MLNRITRNYLYNALYQVFILLMPIIVTPYLARVLGPDNLGIYSYVFSVTNVISILTLIGIYNYGNRQVAYERNDKQKMSQTFWEIMLLRVLIAVVGSVVYFAVAFYLKKFTVYFLQYYCFLLAAYIDCTWLYVGVEDMRPAVLKNFFAKLVGVICIFIFVKQSGDIGKYLLILSISILVANMAAYVDTVGIGTHGYCYIADKEGNIVYHPQQQLIYAGLKEEQSENIRNYEDGTHTEDGIIYTIRSLDNCDWRIIGVSYVDELIESKVAGMIRAVLFVAVMVILATALSGSILAKSFSRPAKQLAAAMRRFVREAESFEFYPVKGTEEIVALSDSFGQMVLQIQELMEKVRNEEITLRKTELSALQAQINPHFLYNTLDSVAWMCEVGRTNEAIEMVNALARLFRISISKGHELITVDQELQHAECYLKIQKFRYKNQFNYTFKVDERCRGYLCNKISLQPLIENCLVHGLDVSEEGEILIEVYENDDEIVMAVSDNGVGMTEEQCEEILKKDVHKKGGIGIKNVNDRVKIYFGERYGVTITSELDEGTRMELHMPKIMEDDYEM